MGSGTVFEPCVAASTVSLISRARSVAWPDSEMYEPFGIIAPPEFRVVTAFTISSPEIRLEAERKVPSSTMYAKSNSASEGTRSFIDSVDALSGEIGSITMEGPKSVDSHFSPDSVVALDTERRSVTAAAAES